MVCIVSGICEMEIQVEDGRGINAFNMMSYLCNNF